MTTQLLYRIIFILLCSSAPFASAHSYDYDITIIGAGTAGLTAAKAAAALGKKVALIEKEQKLGGTYMWTGTIPTRALVHIGRTIKKAFSLEAAHIIALDHNQVLDSTQVMRLLHKIVAHASQANAPEKLYDSGIDVYFGCASFCDAHTLYTGSTTITTDKCIIATGSRTVCPAIPGVEAVSYLTNETIFSLEELPRSLIILGNGAVAVELAYALNRLGVTISMVIINQCLCPHEDREVMTIISKRMQEEGIHLYTDVYPTHICHDTDGSIVLTCHDQQTGVSKNVCAQEILFASKRLPNIEQLALENTGIKYLRNGILVDNTMRTAAKNIYAVGNVTSNRLVLNLVAHKQGEIAVKNAFSFFKETLAHDDAARIFHLDPPFATRGMTEEQARKVYGCDAIRVYRTYYDELDRAYSEEDARGFGKFVCTTDDLLIGAHIFGPDADHLIHEVHLGTSFSSYYQQSTRASQNYLDLLWHASRDTCEEHDYEPTPGFLSHLWHTISLLVSPFVQHH